MDDDYYSKYRQLIQVWEWILEAIVYPMTLLMSVVCAIVLLSAIVC